MRKKDESMSSLGAWKVSGLEGGERVPLATPEVAGVASSPGIPTELDLMRRAGRGDRAAQATLLDGFQDAIYRFCCSMLGDSDAARDATQETALRFLQRLPTFRGESQPRTWVLGIALNVCRESRRMQAPLEILPDEQAAAQSDVSPAADATASEERGLLRSMVAILPERQREAVVLRFFEGLNVNETAEAMSCAAGTVKATVSQALRALREKWSEQR